MEAFKAAVLVKDRTWSMPPSLSIFTAFSFFELQHFLSAFLSETLTLPASFSSCLLLIGSMVTNKFFNYYLLLKEAPHLQAVLRSAFVFTRVKITVAT